MGNLQQQIEYLASGCVLAEDVFQCVSPILLNVEAFVFNFPTPSATAQSQSSSGLRWESRAALGVLLWTVKPPSLVC
jgi:hypothetical protein